MKYRAGLRVLTNFLHGIYYIDKVRVFGKVERVRASAIAAGYGVRDGMFFENLGISSAFARFGVRGGPLSVVRGRGVAEVHPRPLLGRGSLN